MSAQPRPSLRSARIARAVRGLAAVSGADVHVRIEALFEPIGAVLRYKLQADRVDLGRIAAAAGFDPQFDIARQLEIAVQRFAILPVPGKRLGVAS